MIVTNQGDVGEGGRGRGLGVGDGREQGKTGRKPVKWVLPRRRGIVLGGMVQTRLSNFVEKFPNLGLVGGGSKSGESC